MPLIFRPDPAGTWVASLALPPSKYRNPALVPQPTNGATDLEIFSNKLVAVLGFYTINLAVEDDYLNACAKLSSWIAAHGFSPVPGEWSIAWVTYSTAGQIGDRFNECWVEVAAT